MSVGGLAAGDSDGEEEAEEGSGEAGEGQGGSEAGSPGEQGVSRTQVRRCLRGPGLCLLAGWVAGSGGAEWQLPPTDWGPSWLAPARNRRRYGCWSCRW